MFETTNQNKITMIVDFSIYPWLGLPIKYFGEPASLEYFGEAA